MNTREGPQSYLRILRKQAGLTNRDLAFLVGYRARSMVSHLETDRRVPATWELLLIELIFERSAADLFPGMHERVQSFLVSRIEELKEMDRAYQTSKESVRSSIKRVFLDRLLVSLRRRESTEKSRHGFW